MIIKLDYDKNFDEFINDRMSKFTAMLHDALETEDEQQKHMTQTNATNDFTANFRKDLEAKARDNTVPMQRIIGAIINKPDFTFDTATEQDVQKLSQCIFMQNEPLMFQNVNQRNHKILLGYISGSLAMDLAAKNYQFSDGKDCLDHMPIGIVQADTHEPLVFDSSEYTPASPKKPTLNPLKYIFSSDYRKQYRYEKSNYNSQLEYNARMEERTAKTMDASKKCSSKYFGMKQGGDNGKTVSLAECELSNAMAMDHNEIGKYAEAVSLQSLESEEFGSREARTTSTVKSEPTLSKGKNM